MIYSDPNLVIPFVDVLDLLAKGAGARCEFRVVVQQLSVFL